LVFWRFLLAAIPFLPFLRTGRQLTLAAAELSLWLWIGYATQTVGLRYTTSGRSAFLTSLHVIFVPLFVGILGRRTRAVIWLAASIALTGVALLSWDGGPPNIGDLWTLACAVAWAAYITRMETFAVKFPTTPLLAAHICGVVILSAAWLAFEHGPAGFSATPITRPAWLAILYLAIATTAATTWLQLLGQRQVAAPRAAVIYTLEPVWAAGFGYLLLNEFFGWRGCIGAAMVLIASLLARSHERSLSI
jgi:drug/metabolite transporter (DMT)-like permease